MTIINGSDAPRTWRQRIARAIASCVVTGFGLNRPFATEIVQKINPVVRVDTWHGPFLCRGGHGRLVWRAESFLTEEPETVGWLDTLRSDDVLWDVGANVGLYAIFAAKFKKCAVVAFEPEAQNYALLLENIHLNHVEVTASSIALCERSKIARLHVPYLTKGGAYNTFGENGLQLMFGTSIDELVLKHGLPSPTHIKIDVDGNEEQIVAGSERTMATARSVMVEINGESAIRQVMASRNFRVVSDVPCARNDKARNVIFEKNA